nr:uncharacterized protein LOC104085844 isoform X1 [Nicotiana tomentosiformis]
MIENGRTLEWLLRMCQLKKVVMLKAKSRFVNPNVHAKVFFEPTKENSKQTVFWPVLNTCCSLCKFLPILEHYSSLLDITQIFIRVLKLSRSVIFLHNFHQFVPIINGSLAIDLSEKIQCISFQVHRSHINFTVFRRLIVLKILLCFQNPASRITSLILWKFHFCLRAAGSFSMPPSAVNLALFWCFSFLFIVVISTVITFTMLVLTVLCL